MKSESQSSPQPSQEHRQMGLSLNDFWPSLPQDNQTQLLSPSPKSYSLGSPSKEDQGAQVVGKVGRRGRRVLEQAKNINRGHWSIEQNKRYHWFLQIHYRHFVNRHMRRMDKIFKTMELFVGTRQAEQCRSHHQKMEKKYINFIFIVSSLRKEHYGTLDIHPINEELENLGIAIVDKLATIEELKSYRQSDQQVEPKVLKKGVRGGKCEKEKEKESKQVTAGEQSVVLVSVNQVEEQKQKYQMSEQDKINMFDQSQHQNIGDLSMFQEKEDNSCIFSSIFQNLP